EVLADLDERGLVAPIAARVVESETVAALLDACRTADLVVVGRHGLSGRPEDDPAAVSPRLIQEACCPVVVVPE
ncbi:MAG TPA: universal stress protein, partial [Acidimicrobiales bacterium]|nr:universal stress protein [Acidimicrobiales bacterium]